MANGNRHRPDLSPDVEGLFGSLFAQFPVGLALFSVDGRFLRANSTLCRMLGYTESELMQKTHLDVVQADDREAAALLRAQAISGKAKPRLNERRYVRKDGSTLWGHVAGAVQRDAAGTPLFSTAIITD